MARNTLIVLAIMLLSVRAGSADALTPGYDLVLEIAGYVLQKQINSLSDVSATVPSPAGSTEISVDSVLAEAPRPAGPHVRLMAFLDVEEKDGSGRSAQVTLRTDLTLAIGRDESGRITLRIAAADCPPTAAADFECNGWARDIVLQSAPEITRKFVVSIPMEGLNSLAKARPPDSPPLQAIAYELGFGWVLQISAASQTACAPPPRIFLLGDSFTIFIAAGLIQRLADLQLSSGAIPNALSEQGIPQSGGPVAVDRLVVKLITDTMLLEWHGHRIDGTPAVAQWEMAFVSTVDGLVLNTLRMTMDGSEVPVPPGATLVNPIDELIRSSALGDVNAPLFQSPLGRVKLGVGSIRPEGILIAGRA